MASAALVAAASAAVAAERDKIIKFIITLNKESRERVCVRGFPIRRRSQMKNASKNHFVKAGSVSTGEFIAKRCTDSTAL